MRVAVKFALVDHALLASVNEFDRIFDRQDMPLNVIVQMVDHRGERGRFTGACRASHQDQAAWRVDDVPEDWRCANIFQRPHRIRNGPERSTNPSVMMETVDTKSCKPLDRVGIINLQVSLEI